MTNRHPMRHYGDEIDVMNADGSNRHRLKGSPDENDGSPDWSSDGRSIAFTSDRTGYSGIYVMNADGSNERRLMSNTSDTDDVSPSWSPDGKRIAFASDRGGHGYQIYVMNADGSGQHRVTQNLGRSEYQPAWSPDGRQIAFSSGSADVYGHDEIYVINSDGTNEHRLTRNRAEDLGPAWSPDGRKLAFTRDSQIYVMNADPHAEQCRFVHRSRLHVAAIGCRGTAERATADSRWFCGLLFQLGP